MLEPLPIFTSLVLGLLLGGVFFGGLWIAIRQIDKLSHPVAWILASWLLRFGLMISVLYLVARNLSGAHLVVVLVGMLLARFIARLKVNHSIRKTPL